MDEKERNLLIEWLYVITGDRRAFWSEFDDDTLYNLYIKQVDDHQLKMKQ